MKRHEIKVLIRIILEGTAIMAIGAAIVYFGCLLS